MNRKTIKKIRRTYLIFSIIIGIISPLILLYFSPDFDPRTDPVSKFRLIYLLFISVFIKGIIIFCSCDRYHFIMYELRLCIIKTIMFTQVILNFFLLFKLFLFHVLYKQNPHRWCFCAYSTLNGLLYNK